MAKELSRGFTGSRFTKGGQSFNVGLEGFKKGMLTLHRIPGDVTKHLNRDMEKMAKRVLKYALENLKKKVYEPAGVNPEIGGPHQTKSYWLTGNLYKSGRWNEVSGSEAAEGTSAESPSLGE